MVEARPDGLPGTTLLRDMDPRFTSCTVRFDVDEPASATIVAPTSATTPPTPTSSYIARDYEALRQLLLTNLVQDMPDWSEQHVPDVVIMLIELFAFLGDDLSYYRTPSAPKRICRPRGGALDQETRAWSDIRSMMDATPAHGSA